MNTKEIILWDTTFGKINCNLKNVMKNKMININQLSRITGLKYDVIIRYYNNEIIKFDSSVLAKICYSLNCEVSDLLKYQRSM